MSAVAETVEPQQQSRRFQERWRWVARLASWVVFVAVWQFLGTYVVEPFILPPPSILLPELVEIVQSGELLRHFGSSLGKLAQSFPLFFLAGAFIGTVMALSPWWEDFLRDAVSVATSLPGLVYILVLLLIFGTSGWAPIVAIVAAVTPFIILQFWAGVKGISTELLQMGSAFKVSRGKVVRHIMIPALTPFILTAITHGISIGWRLVVLTELFGGSSGIGFKMRAEFSHFAVRGVVAWALFFFFISLLFDRVLFAPVSNWILRWRESDA